MKFLSELFQPLIDFIYPSVCLSCTKKLPDGEQLICKSCWQKVQRAALPAEFEKELMSKFSIDGYISKAFSSFYFEEGGVLQSIIYALKYDGKKSIGVMLGKCVGELIRNDDDFGLVDILIPVPLHKTKQRERGYNQSDYICRGISQMINIPFRTDILKRRKYTISQTQLNREERRQNVAGAFKVNRRRAELVRGKILVLVDDVITTGSTINECAKTLLENGARNIYAVSVAVAAWKTMSGRCSS